MRQEEDNFSAYVPLHSGNGSSGNGGGSSLALAPTSSFIASSQPWQLVPGTEVPHEIPSPSASPQVFQTPTADEARSIVRQFYLNVLGREPDANGWDFWSGSFVNEVGLFQRERGQTYTQAFTNALDDLRLAFKAAVGADYEKPFHPVTMLDAFNGYFANPAKGGASTSGDFVVVPQDTGSSGGTSTRLLVILALVGIAATVAIHYYFKHHG